MKTNYNSCYINGSWNEFKNLPKCNIINPFNLELITQVPNCGAEECLEAIKAAEKSFHQWKDLLPKERASYLKKLAGLISENANELAALLTKEQGKPIKEALAEIKYGQDYFEWFSEEAKRVYGDIIPSPVKNKSIYVNKEPVGVVAIITPWNFPNAMIARKMAAALAAGCTIVIKPALETPLSALALADLCEQVGIPAGVVNVITGDAEPIAKAFADSDLVRKISFTGSTAVGKKIMASSASTLKRVTMELGGNAPLIICEDADIDLAVESSLKIKFRNSGQTCVCVNRFIVNSKIQKEFERKFKAKCESLKVGDGALAETDIGPLINEKAKDKIKSLNDDALKKGAQSILSVNFKDNLLCTPAILSNINKTMTVWSDEIFGPLACIASFNTDEEALELANDTEYGLAAYLFTQNLKRISQFTSGLKFGMVGVNTDSISHAEIPFGGIKHSGFGREGSKYGLDDYLNIKCIQISQN